MQTPSRGVVFEHAHNDRRRMEFYAMAKRTLSAHTALLATTRCTPLRSFLERCGNDVRTPLWCNGV